MGHRPESFIYDRLTMLCGRAHENSSYVQIGSKIPPLTNENVVLQLVLQSFKVDIHPFPCSIHFTCLKLPLLSHGLFPIALRMIAAYPAVHFHFNVAQHLPNKS